MSVHKTQVLPRVVEIKSASLVAVSKRITRSYAITIVFSYFDIEDAIKFQILNKHMYDIKTPQMCFSIVGRRIEQDVCIYDVYANKKGKVVVVVGAMPPGRNEAQINKNIEEYMATYPLFASKFSYEGYSWPCHEKPSLHLAVFGYKHGENRIRLPPN